MALWGRSPGFSPLFPPKCQGVADDQFPLFLFHSPQSPHRSPSLPLRLWLRRQLQVPSGRGVHLRLQRPLPLRGWGPPPPTMASPAALGLSLLLPALVTTAVAAAPFASPAPGAQAPSAQAPSVQAPLAQPPGAQAPGAPAGLPPGSSLDGPAPAPAQALRWRQEPAVERLFRRAGKSGTFVLFDPDRGLMRGHDRHRAETRFTPASTFKIANSLIGLSVGAVASVDEVLPYRSNDPPFSPAWVKDMGLRQAKMVSNVPIYQELARRIGLERMRQGVVKLGYGNEQIGTQVDRFWLRGPLAISAVEQTLFLNRLARKQLPFPIPAQRAVAAITVVERGEGWVLHAKTGWQNGPGAGVGWWVGWVERGGRVYPFALNLDLGGRADADLRLSLGRAALKATGVLP